MGADHTAGNAITLTVDHLDPTVQAQPISELQKKTMVMDTLGFCIFTGRVAFADTSLIEEAIEAIAGWHVSFSELLGIGDRLLRVERDFNARAGFSSAHDRLPEFMRKQPLPPHNSVFDIPQEVLDHFYDAPTDAGGR